MDQFSKHISLVPRVASQNAPETLSQTGDISILNAGQCQVFDQIINHYLHPQVTQLLMHLDGVAGSGKSILIDMISSHMAYYAAQHRHPDPVLQAASTGVAAYNIHSSTLHQLLSLPMNRPWYELGREKLAAMQAEF